MIPNSRRHTRKLPRPVLLLTLMLTAAPSLMAVPPPPKDEIRIESSESKNDPPRRTSSRIDIDLRKSRPATTAPASTSGAPGTPTPNAQANSHTAASTSTLPQNYQTAPTEDIQAEIKRLRESAEQLSPTSKERRDLEDLIDAHELRLRTGIPVSRLVEEITSKVAEIRQLEVKEPVRFRMISRQELRKLLEHHLTKDYPGESLQNTEAVMKLLGAIPDRVDLRKTIVSLLSEQIAGLYDPETKLLYIMQHFDLNRSLARIILAHEIGHALQDQHFDLLSMPITALDNSDLQIAAQSVIEGDATLLMQDYAAEALTLNKLPELLDAFLIDQSALDRAPYFLQRQLVFPYMGGADFLQSVILQKGDEARDNAFRKCPVSTEQILHPDKYLTTREYDPPTTVTLPDLSAKLGDGWTSVTQNVVGEFQLKTIFEAWREWDVAPRAADGWDGDKYVLYRKGETHLLLWLSVWDSESDATDFFTLYSELMRMRRYREHFARVEYPGSGLIRRLPIRPETPSEEAPVRLRFHRAGSRVLVAITNSEEALQALEPHEDSLVAPAESPQP